MSPPLHLPLPPQTSPACSRQERTGLSERQKSARTRGRQAGLANLGLPPQDFLRISTAFCGHATNEVQTGMQACSHAAAGMKCTRTHTHIHSHTPWHPCTHTHPHTHKRAHPHIHTDTHRHTHAHSSYSTQRKASTIHRMQQQQQQQQQQHQQQQ